MISVLGGLALIALGAAALFASVIAGADLRAVGFAGLAFGCVMCLPLIALALPIGGAFALWIGIAESSAAYLWSGALALALAAASGAWFGVVWIRDRAAGAGR